MLVRDQYSGTLHEVPDLGEYDVGEVVYDGFGNPVAIAPPGLAFDEGLSGTLGLPFLLPLLPAIASAASAAIPAITKMFAKGEPSSGPPPPMTIAPAQTPPMSTAPPAFVVPGPNGPIVFRRHRRRSPHAR
jgi:hypothetical protein